MKQIKRMGKQSNHKNRNEKYFQVRCYNNNLRVLCYNVLSTITAVLRRIRIGGQVSIFRPTQEFLGVAKAYLPECCVFRESLIQK